MKNLKRCAAALLALVSISASAYHSQLIMANNLYAGEAALVVVSLSSDSVCDGTSDKKCHCENKKTLLLKAGAEKTGTSFPSSNRVPYGEKAAAGIVNCKDEHVPVARHGSMGWSHGHIEDIYVYTDLDKKTPTVHKVGCISSLKAFLDKGTHSATLTLTRGSKTTTMSPESGGETTTTHPLKMTCTIGGGL